MAEQKSEERSVAVGVARGKPLDKDSFDGSPLLKELPGLYKFGELWAFDRNESGALKELKRLIESYVAQQNPSRPLCVAVFGAPGSGKSRSVKQIRKMLEDDEAERDRQFPWLELNLTQIHSAVELSRRLQAVSIFGGASTPFVFFDEFDAPRDGSRWGWLSWFLAPMQDAKFEVEFGTVECRRAIYFFAGGTAHSAAKFGQSSPVEFAAAKGPDFASRLRATLDIRGTNDPVASDLRRAMTIGFEVGQAKKIREMDLVPEETLVKSLLDAGRYKHGARSIAAIVEMAIGKAVLAAGKKKGRVSIRREHLPPSQLATLHVDRGPLDPRTIGGNIGMSGGGVIPTTELVDKAWCAIAEELLHEGACIGYGGHWEKGGLTYELVHTAETLPGRLETDNQVDPYIEVFSTEAFPTRATEEATTEVPPNDRVSITECRPMVDSNWSDPMKAAVKATHMRRVMNARCVARILMCGKDEGYSGRMPGIVEEAVWAFSHGQPIYLLGGFGGAAEAMGSILGLAGRDFRERKIGKPKHDVSVDELEFAKEVFVPASMPSLPLTLAETGAWLMDYAIGGPGWADNGLSIRENRQLFKTEDLDEILRLLHDGLLRTFDR